MSAVGSEVPSQWSFEVTVRFVEVPPEKEAAFWAAMDYFARVMFSPPPPPLSGHLPQMREGHPNLEEDGECSELVDGTRVTALDGQE